MWEEFQIQMLKPSAWVRLGVAIIVTLALYRLGMMALNVLRPRMSANFYPVLRGLLIAATMILFAGLATFAFYLTSSPFFAMGQSIMESLQATGGQLVVIVALALVAWALIGELASLIVPSDDFNRRSVRVRTLKGVVESTLKAVVLFTALIAVLQTLGVNATSLLASASVLGLAVSFGAQSLIKDIFNGFFILLSDQYGVGDDIVLNLGDVAGTVEDINLRTTSVRDLSGTLHIMQNGQINTISVKSKDWSRVVATVDVAYEADIDEAILVLERVGRELYSDPQWAEHFLAEPDIQGVIALGPDAVTLRALFKVMPKSQYAIGREFNRRIKIALDEEGIHIPYPQRRMSFGDGPLEIRLVRGEKSEQHGEKSESSSANQNRHTPPVEPSFSRDAEENL